MRDNKKKINDTNDRLPTGSAIRWGNRPFFRILRVILFIYLGLTGVVWAMQRSYIYYPEKAPEERLLQAAKEMGLEAWVNMEGERIGWKKTGMRGEGYIVVFHGNAGHALHRFSYVNLFNNLGEAGVAGIFLFEYPGYASRAGSPSEDAFFRTGTSALEQLLAETNEPIYLLGESLGSGVACYLAGSMPEQVDGLLLITPFDSLVSVGQAHFPFLPVGWLLRDRYENSKHLAHYHGPVAIIIAGNDEVVPARLGEKLYEEYEGPKEIQILPDATHNTLLQRAGHNLWRDVLKFLRQSI